MTTDDDKRIREIKIKLQHIPEDDEEVKRYYVYYKEDVRFLLTKLKNNDENA